MADKGEHEKSEEIRPAELFKKKKSQGRRRNTLSIKRIRDLLERGPGEDKRRRLKKELQQLRRD